MAGAQTLEPDARLADKLGAQNLIALNQAAQYWAVRRGLNGDVRLAVGVSAVCLVSAARGAERGTSLVEEAYLICVGLLLLIGAILLAASRRPVILLFLSATVAALALVFFLLGLRDGTVAGGLFLAGLVLLWAVAFLRSYRLLLSAREHVDPAFLELIHELTRRIFKEDRKENTKLLAFRSSPHLTWKWRARLFEEMMFVVKKLDSTALGFLSGGDAFFVGRADLQIENVRDSWFGGGRTMDLRAGGREIKGVRMSTEMFERLKNWHLRVQDDSSILSGECVKADGYS